jgi:hypothetical protein
MMQPRLGHGDRGKSVVHQAGDEVHFAQRIARVPLRFYINAFGDRPARRVRAVVGDEIRLS